MIGASIALLCLGILLAEPASRALAAARWPARDPAGALLLWQAIGLAGGLALVGAGLTFGLSPLGDSLPAAIAALTAPDALGQLDIGHALALIATVALTTRLLGMLGLATWRTLAARQRHRELLDLLATPLPTQAGGRVLAHSLPVAYCLPGPGARLVVSEGALTTLSPAELDAVLHHERAHLREHHDLVILPFVAWAASAPFVPGMARAAAAVARLVEMRADDVARSALGAAAIRGALTRVGGSAGTAGLTSFSASVSDRLARLADRPARPSPVGYALPRLAAVALLAVPTIALLFT